jgi:hypothetical protein
LWSEAGFVKVLQHSLVRLVDPRVKTYEEDLKKLGLADVDVENMRVNIREVRMAMMALTILYALKGLSGDDDGEEQPFVYYMINQTSRIGQELTFFYSPNSALQIMRDAVPSTKTFMDAWDVVNASQQYFTDPESRFYQRGPRKGRLKLAKEASELIPVMRGVELSRSITSQVFGNNTYRR